MRLTKEQENNLRALCAKLENDNTELRKYQTQREKDFQLDKARFQRELTEEAYKTEQAEIKYKTLVEIIMTAKKSIGFNIHQGEETPEGIITRLISDNREQLGKLITLSDQNMMMADLIGGALGISPASEDTMEIPGGMRRRYKTSRI